MRFSFKKNGNSWYRVSQKKLSLYVLLHISGTKKQIFKPFVSAENWDPYADIEYRAISVRFHGTEKFVKQNGFLNKKNHIHTN